MIQLFDMSNYARRFIEADKTGSPIRTVFNLIQGQQDVCICVWDGKGGNKRRRALYPDYKGNRKFPETNIYEHMMMLKELLKLSKAITVEVPGYEGDDVIATLVTREFPGQISFIQTTDMDMLTLPGVKIDREKPAPAPAHHLRLYKTMVGDTSDNIKGISKFGSKSWDELIDGYKDILIELFTRGEDIDWSGVPMSKASQKWISNLENAELIKTYWQITGFFDVPTEEIKPISGANQPRAAWEIMNQFLQ